MKQGEAKRNEMKWKLNRNKIETKQHEKTS